MATLDSLLNTPTHSDVFDFINQLPNKCIQTVVTSPPYFGLRNYKIAERLWGGDESCEHQFTGEYKGPTKMAVAKEGYRDPKWKAVIEKANKIKYTQFCSKCWAWKGSLGSEPFPELFIDHLVEVFVAMKPHLHKTATLWVNLGDSYARSSGSWGITKNTPSVAKGDSLLKTRIAGRNPTEKPPFLNFYSELGYKPKDLIGIPWGFAFAMRSAGFYLRQDIIWVKPNPMPEPVMDRCTASHEYIFLFSLSPKYFYDKYAIMEPLKEIISGPKFGGTGRAGGDNPLYSGREYDAALIPGRNKRSVWVITAGGNLPKELKGKHFAAFPEKIPEICIKAGTPHKVCAKCRSPYVRVVEKKHYSRNDDWKGDLEEKNRKMGEAGLGAGSGDIYPKSSVYMDEKEFKGFEPWEGWKRSSGADSKGEYHGKSIGDPSGAMAQSPSDVKRNILKGMVPKETVGFQKTCKCGSSDVAKPIVFDPFSGTFTTAVVAEKLERDWLGCDVGERFVDLGVERLKIQVRKGVKLKQMEWW